MVTDNFSTGHLWWSQSILPTINDRDHRAYKPRSRSGTPLWDVFSISVALSLGAVL